MPYPRHLANAVKKSPDLTIVTSRLPTLCYSLKYLQSCAPEWNNQTLTSYGGSLCNMRETRSAMPFKWHPQEDSELRWEQTK